jgi:hypothetical protein
MNHQRIEREGIAELYATGRLSPEDEDAFEIHLLECRECRDRVELADDLRSSFRMVAAEDATRTALQAGLFAGLSRAVRRGLLLGALLALAALPAWLLVDRQRLARELAAARTAVPPTAPARPVPALPPPRDDGRLERLVQERRSLEEELRRERAERERLAERLTGLARPQINTAIYSLGLVRGETVNEVTLDPASGWIVLSLELPQAGHASYRATLLSSRGATVWRGDGLAPTASDTLTVLVPPDLLQPGDYRFRLEGLEDRGHAVAAGEIPFRVRRPS